MGFGLSVEERMAKVRDTAKTVSRDMGREVKRVQVELDRELIMADNADFNGDRDGQRDHLTRVVELRRQKRRYLTLKARIEAELTSIDTQRVDVTIYRTSRAMHSVLATLYGDTNAEAFQASLQQHVKLLESFAMRREMIESSVSELDEEETGADDLTVADEVERMMGEASDMHNLELLEAVPGGPPSKRVAASSSKAQ